MLEEIRELAQDQEYGHYKCRMNNHLYRQDRTYLSFYLNNLYDYVLIYEVGDYLANIPP